VSLSILTVCQEMDSSHACYEFQHTLLCDPFTHIRTLFRRLIQNRVINLENMMCQDTEAKIRIAALRLKYEILKHAVENAKKAVDDAQRDQERSNLKALNAPIQDDRIKQFDSDSSRVGDSDKSDDGMDNLFNKAVEKGITAASTGRVVKAQGELAQAR
jgi:hypothetical protein